MNLVSRYVTKRLPARFRKNASSLRTHLIFWNVVALALMLGLLGVVCRLVTLQVIMGSVNDEMARTVRMFRRPPPFDQPPGMNNGHGPGAPPTGPNDMRGPEPGAPQGVINGHDQHRPQGGPNEMGGPPSGRPPGGNGRRGPRPPDADNPYHPHLFNAHGVSAQSDDMRAVWDPAGLDRALHGQTVYNDVTIDDEPLRVISAPAYTHERERGAVQYAYPLKEVYRAVSAINLALLLLAPFGLAGAGLVGVSLTNRVLRRVQVMTQAAGKIGAADFSRRLPVTGDDEFSELAETFNGLLGGLDAAYQQQQELMKLQQRFTADASHELKTPLTIIKGRAGLGVERTTVDDKTRRAFEEIEAAANTMDKLVQDLLLLARSDEGRLGSQQTELLVQDVLSTARAQTAGAERVHLEIHNEETTIKGNEGELVRVFRNLIDNALSYSPSDKPVLVAARGEFDKAVVTVTDQGHGIAPEHLHHLGERFYRVDSSRTRPTGGTGLGLSICSSIVSAHGGTIDFESVVGEGTKVTVGLPTAR